MYNRENIEGFIKNINRVGLTALILTSLSSCGTDPNSASLRLGLSCPDKPSATMHLSQGEKLNFGLWTIYPRGKQGLGIRGINPANEEDVPQNITLYSDGWRTNSLTLQVISSDDTGNVVKVSVSCPTK